VPTQRLHWKPVSHRAAYLPSRRSASSLVVVMAAVNDQPRRTVLWFRNDLRVHDSVTVHEAAQRVKNGQSDEVWRWLPHRDPSRRVSWKAFDRSRSTAKGRINPSM